MNGPKVSVEICKKCKYFYGISAGDYKNCANNSGVPMAMCSYFLDTGKHRFDDFGSERKRNEWVNVCDKFTPKNNYKKPKAIKPMTVSKAGLSYAENRKRYGEV